MSWKIHETRQLKNQVNPFVTSPSVRVCLLRKPLYVITFANIVTKDGILVVYRASKSTTAELLKFYLSKNDMHEGIRSWLDNCEFQKYEDNCAGADAEYKKFRSSSSFVIKLDLSRVFGKTRSGLERCYAEYIIDCWRTAGIPDAQLNSEEELFLKEPTEVWTSFSRLRRIIHRIYEGRLYVILDSLDSMYNLIANLSYNDSKCLFMMDRITILMNHQNLSIAHLVRGLREAYIDKINNVVLNGQLPYVPNTGLTAVLLTSEAIQTYTDFAWATLVSNIPDLQNQLSTYAHYIFYSSTDDYFGFYANGISQLIPTLAYIGYKLIYDVTGWVGLGWVDKFLFSYCDCV